MELCKEETGNYGVLFCAENVIHVVMDKLKRQEDEIISPAVSQVVAVVAQETLTVILAKRRITS